MRTALDYSQLGARFLRMAWCRRLESGLTLASVCLHAFLDALLGLEMGTAILALLAGAFICCGPSRSWMLGRYRAQGVERRAGKAFEAAGIAVANAPAVTGWRPTPSGVAYGLALHPGCVADDLDRSGQRLAVAFGARTVTVSRDRARAGRAELLVSYRDPLAEAPVPWPWTSLTRSQLWGGLPFGYDEDGALVVLELAGRHLLVGGEPGAGKSNALSLVVGAAALDPSVELWCFDGKLVELAAWRRVARRFVGPDLHEATVVLGELRSEMESRYTVLLERGLRQLRPELGLGLVVAVIDELALYLQSKGKARDEFAEVLRDVVARGRAAGVVVVAATQKPAFDVIPTSIRDLFGLRLAMRCATRDASDTILGAGAAQRGYSAAELDPASRGVGYLLAEGTVPRRMRCFVLDDDHLSQVAARAERLRGVVR